MARWRRRAPISRMRKRSPGVTPTRSGWWSDGSGASVPRRPGVSWSGTIDGRVSSSSRHGRAPRTLERLWRSAGIAVEPAAYGAGLVTDRRRPEELPGYRRRRVPGAGPGAGAARLVCRPARRRDGLRRGRVSRREDDRARARGSAGGRGGREPAPGGAPRAQSPARRQRSRAPDRGRRAPAAGPAGRCGAARRAVSRHRHLRAASGCANAGHARGAGAHHRHPGRSCSTAWPTWSRRAGS